MSCEQCRDIEEKDGVGPDCEAGRGCRIPPLGPDEAKVLRMRSMLLSLQGLVDPGTVLRMYGATREDVELMAVVEEELKEMKGEGLDDRH